MVLASCLLLASFAHAQPVNPYLMPVPTAPMNTPQAYPAASPYFFPLPAIPFPIQMQPSKPLPPYTMRRTISPQEKAMMMQMAMPLMTTLLNMSMADAMNYFAVKYQAKPGLSFDEVVESMMLRSNQLNFKYVGSNLLWKDFHAVLDDKTSPRVEVHSFCDIAVGRELLKISPEFLVFLPCRIAVMEDADRKIWVMMLDWSLDWVGAYREKLGITDALWAGAKDIRWKMEDIMRAAANGDI
jgi:uncharacterized protein (DUF302 family)